MPFNSNASAVIYITGLAICRKQQQDWQVLFLHPSIEHKLKVRVFELRADGNMDEKSINGLTGSHDKIEIEITNPKFAGLEHRTGDLRDDTSMDWIIDLNNIHGRNFRMKPGLQAQTSYLSLPKAKFFHYEKTEGVYALIDTNTGDALFKRKIGETIRAEIEGDNDWTINVKINGQSNPFRKTDGVKYEIFMDNSCEGMHCPQGPDFILYYNFLNLSSGNPFTLEKKIISSEKDNNVIVGILADEAACNSVTGDPGCDLADYYTAGNP